MPPVEGSPYRVVDGAVLLAVRITPRSSRHAIGGLIAQPDGRAALAVRIAAPPVDGAANAALLGFLAKALRLRLADVALQSGETGRLKILRLTGDPAAIVGRLDDLGLPGRQAEPEG